MGGRRIAIGVSADGEVDLIRGMVDLLRDQLDRVVVVEARRTFQGAPRDVLGDQWAELLDLPPGQFRSVVTDLPATATADVQENRRRARFQRSAVGLGVNDYDPDDLLIALDADEFLDPAWLAEESAGIDVPTRLRFVPLYGGLDRRAPDWHCCRRDLQLQPGVWLDDDEEPTWLIPAGVAIPVHALRSASAATWRSRPAAVSERAAGWHLLHVTPPAGDRSRKLVRQAHVWHPDLDRSYMDRMIELGVQPYGWWAASALEVPDTLRPFAEQHPAAVRGPLPSTDERRAAMTSAFERFADVDAQTSQVAGHEHD